jgi:DNA-binding NarL/FixJ family response regulator
MTVTAAVQADEQLILLLDRTSASTRVKQVREALELRPDALVVASMPGDASGADMRKVLAAGARGILLDDDVPTALGPTIAAVSAGQLVVPPTLRRQLAPQALSHREKEVLRLMADGYTNRQIADALYVAESTVKTHLSSAFRRLGVHSRREAAALVLASDDVLRRSVLTTLRLTDAFSPGRDAP